VADEQLQGQIRHLQKNPQALAATISQTRVGKRTIRKSFDENRRLHVLTAG
jgi:hypothetical protein